MRRESIEWIACAAPSVSEEVSRVRREFDRVDRLRGSVGQRRSQRAEPVVNGFGDRFRPRVEGLFKRFEPAVDQFIERFDLVVERRIEIADLAVEGGIEIVDLAVERGIEIGDAGSKRGLELQEALVQRGGDLAAIRSEAVVEGVDIGLQRLRDVLGALTHAIDDFAAEGFDGAIEFRNVPGDQGAEGAAVAGEFFDQLSALVLHQFVEGTHLKAERVMGVLGLADDLRHQRVHGHVKRIAGLVAGAQDLGRETIAGVVDLAHEIAAAQFKLQKQGVARILQGIMNLFGAVGNAVDNGGRALLELGGDAVDPLVQHLVDAVGQLDEFVVDVAGLEIQAGSEALAGVEHRAGGFRAGFLESVEQVAAALAERQDHVVAGIAERAGDVAAALFQRAGDALGHFIDPRCDRVRYQCDVVTQIDLHAGNGAAHLFGLPDQVVALMGDILQQGADPYLVVAVGAFKRGDFVGDQGFKFAGTRDGALDAVTHGRDFAPDRLTDCHHRVAGCALGLRKTDRDLRHRLRDHPQFLAAPGQTRHEIEQQYRREEQGRQAGQRQGAAGALTDGSLQRRQETEGQHCGADQPDRGEKRGQRVDVAGRPALLNGLQNLPDGFAVVIGGAAGRARLFDEFEDRQVVAGPGIKGLLPGIERGLIEIRRRG